MQVLRKRCELLKKFLRVGGLILLTFIVSYSSVFSQRNPAAPNSVDVSPDGAFYATGHFDRTIRIWDASTQQTVLTIEDTQEVSSMDDTVHLLHDLEFSPTGMQIAASFGGGLERGGAIRIFDVSTGQLLQEFGGGGSAVDISWNPDGSLIAAKTTGGSLGFVINYVTVWNVQTGEIVAQIEHGINRSVIGLAWSPDGTLLASADWNSIIMWNTTTWSESAISLVGDDAVAAIAWSSDATRVAAVDISGNVYIWDASTGQRQMKFPSTNSDQGRHKIAWSTDNRIAAQTASEIRGWDPDTGQNLFEIDAPGINDLAWLPNGDMLYSSGAMDSPQIIPNILLNGGTSLEYSNP